MIVQWLFCEYPQFDDGFMKAMSGRKKNVQEVLYKKTTCCIHITIFYEKCICDLH